jgi:protein ImuB
MFATIYLPNFYLQAALRHHPKLRAQPVGLIDPTHKKVAIIELNDAAEQAGITKGMTPSQALARCLQVVIRTRERARENLIGDILLQHAFMLSPFVEATAPGICTVQLWHRHPADGRRTGTSLAGSQCYVQASRVLRKLEKCEIRAHIGIASLPDTSLLAAHLARPILEIDEPKKFLAPMPIETLAMA